MSDGSVEWPEDDDIDWVRLYVLRPGLYYSLLRELEERPEPTAVARFVEKCIVSLRCVRDFHDQLSRYGLTLARFADLYEKAWAAQLEAVEHEERPVDDGDDVVGWGGEHRLKGGRLDAGRAGWRPDLNEALAPEMRSAIVNLHLRGVDDDRIACVLGVPSDWPAKVVGRARVHRSGREVVRLHLGGASLGQIAAQTGVPTASVARILRLIDEKPNGAARRVDARNRARTIVKLRDRGLSYKQITERVGCSLDDVKNALRRDRRHRYGDRGPAD